MAQRCKTAEFQDGMIKIQSALEKLEKDLVTTASTELMERMQLLQMLILDLFLKSKLMSLSPCQYVTELTDIQVLTASQLEFALDYPLISQV